MTYVVLVILIALWAMVLLPPYLKDRRASGRTFRPGQSSQVNSAQRFLPLQQASARYSTNAPAGVRSGISPLGSSPVGQQRGSAVSPLGTAVGAAPAPATGYMPENVVQLRPADESTSAGLPGHGGAHNPAERAPLAMSAAAYLEESPYADEAALQQAWGEGAGSAGLRMPQSSAEATERRRHVMFGLTGLAFATLLMAYFAGGMWIALHLLVDIATVGYVILLVRHRQMMADRMMKIEPIRPPVSEQPPASVQLAPSYLLRSKTGS